MTSGELVPVEPEGLLHGGEVAPSGQWSVFSPQNIVPGKYIELFRVGNTTNAVVDHAQSIKDVAGFVTTVIRDIVVRGESYADTPVPVSADMTVIGETLKAVAETPLTSVYGNKLRLAQEYWNRFRDGTANAYRQQHGLGRSDPVNLWFRLPQTSPLNGFDPLEKAFALNAEVDASVAAVCQLGRLARYSTIGFRGCAMGQSMHVGDGSVGSTFLFRDGFMPSNGVPRSFRRAKDANIVISTIMQGTIGPLKGHSQVSAYTTASNSLNIIGNNKDVVLGSNALVALNLVNPVEIGKLLFTQPGYLIRMLRNDPQYKTV